MSRSHARLWFAPVIGLVAVAAFSTCGAEPAPTTPAAASAGNDASLERDSKLLPLKPPDTSSPRATLESFVEFADRSYRVLMAAHAKNLEAPGLFTPDALRKMEDRAEILIQRSIHCLDLSKIPAALKADVGLEAALTLKEILDRIELPRPKQIPDAAAIEKEEEEKKFPHLTRWQLPDTEIIIARVETGRRRGEYLFSPETVLGLKGFYARVENLPYRSEKFVSRGFLEFYIRTPGRLLPPKWAQWVPAWTKRTVASQTVWQWCALALSMVLALACLWALLRRHKRLAREASLAGRLGRRVLFCIAAILIVAVLHEFAVNYVNVTGWVLITLTTAGSLCFWLLFAVMAFFSGRTLAEVIVASPKIDPEGIQASYIRALFGVIGFAAGATLAVVGLSRIGVSLIPLLTGVGIGGLAVALAARPTIENVIGSFMIFVDKPYRVGDRIRAMSQDGTVESIGLRSTKIRLLSGNSTAIPNEKMAAVEIENIGRRPFIRRVFNVTITYDTPPEMIRRAVEILREILAVPETPAAATNAHPNEAINKAGFPPRVFFNELNSDSLNIYVSYWYHPPEWWDYLAHAHQINLEIMERFNAEGIDFAFPTQTLHLAGDEKRPVEIGHR